MPVVGSVWKQKLVRLLAVATILLPTTLLAGPEEDFQLGAKAFDEDDLLVAMESLKKASEAGHLKAMVLLGDLLDRAEQNAEAVQWYRNAAEQGDEEGMINLGLMYTQGEGVAKDDTLATTWVEKAAAKGSGRAMMILSNAYRLGEMGLRIDFDKAFDWLAKSTESNYSPAVRQMAEVYRKGLLGFDPDPQLAKEWEAEYQTLTKKESGGKKGAKQK